MQLRGRKNKITLELLSCASRLLHHYNPQNVQCRTLETIMRAPGLCIIVNHALASRTCRGRDATRLAIYHDKAGRYAEARSNGLHLNLYLLMYICAGTQLKARAVCAVSKKARDMSCWRVYYTLQPFQHHHCVPGAATHNHAAFSAQ
jgi:hypothetical protein